MVTWVDIPTFLVFCSFTRPNWCGLVCPPSESVWIHSDPSVFCLWWLPKTFVRVALLSARMSWGGELRPLGRFSLLSVAVFRWTGSRWTPLVLPLWIAAGSELLRVIILALSCSLGSFFSSTFGNEVFRLLVNLDRPSPLFRKALLGGACSALVPSWLC